MLTLYDYLPSGNGYKVRLLLSQLGRPFELVEKDILKGETRTPEFLAINPNGRIPVLVLEDGRRLAESDAILFYLAEGTPYLPEDRFERAEVLQWLFFEQYSHEPSIAVARFWIHSLGKRTEWAARLEEKWQRGHQALAVMERHLDGRRFFVGERYGIADIALYAYTHVAEEGEFDLSGYPRIRAWLDRVADQPGHVMITQGVF
ncbi:glutathione S-transferase family protein [Rhodospirillaceae bacterium SYSU D60014]|uniref:glutathione S-transferase family protein n=1 Tax=Virgifigura deserti TaxID=2268457 RepID=UPI000E661F99